MPTTPEEQLFLEWINRARANPAGEYDELVTDAATRTGVTSDVTAALRFFRVDMDLLATQLAGYDAVAPVAWNDSLGQSAETHNNLMIAQDTQGHYLDGEPGMLDRIRNAGYENPRTVAENVYAYAESLIYGHAGFYIDWGNTSTGIQNPAGHRETILNGTYTEVGIAWVAENNGSTGVGPYVTTQHFATSWGYDPQLVGVVIDDADGDDFYDIGEGMGGVTITAVGGGATYTTTSWDSGGYQMELPDGSYDVTFSGGGLTGVITGRVTVAGENVKLDGIADEAVLLGETLTGTNADEHMIGGAYNDTIDSGRGNDTLEGAGGDDSLSAGVGDDSATGGDGADTVKGGIGEDILYGDGGNDIMRGQSNADAVHGGDGDDNVKGGGGNDTLTGGAGNDFLKGGTRKDHISGGDDDDQLFGNSFDDTLIGGAGEDTLNAGGENDRLEGGADDDVMKGGGGDDVFVFDLGHGSDRIVDFGNGADMLEISAALAGGLDAAGIEAAAALTTDGVEISLAAGDVILLEGLTDTTGLAAMIDVV